MKKLLVTTALLVAAACAGPSAPNTRSTPSGRSTTDSRVKSYMGQVPPDVFSQGTWVGRAGETSLAALRGRVVYVQFAFPQ